MADNTYQPTGSDFVANVDPDAASQGRVKSIQDRISKAITNIKEVVGQVNDEEGASLLLEGTEDERRDKRDEIFDKIHLTQTEVNEKRLGRLLIMRDMYENNLTKYTNIFGSLELNKRGHVRASYNYMSQIVDKLTNFLTSKPPIITVPARQVDDPVELERSTSLRYFLDNVHHANRFKYFFKRSAHMQSLFGDTYIKGPYWDPTRKKICYEWVEDLGNVHIGWKDNRFEEVDWVAFHHLESVESLKRKYGKDFNAYEGTIIMGTYPAQSPTNRFINRTDRQTMIQEALVTEYWDGEVMSVIINEQEIVQYVEHEYGFVPFYKVENIHVDNRPWGKSDIEELIDANVELNERMGDAGDAIRQGAVVRYKVINDPNFDTDSVKAGSNGQFIFANGEKADVMPIPSAVNISRYEAYLKNVQQIIYDLGLPAVAWGGSNAAVTGRALDMQYQAITDKIENKRIVWEMALEVLNERILMLAEKYIPGMKKIIDGHYTTEFDWESVIPYSEQDKVVNISNKKDRGMISYHTALKELGYKDPDSEIDLMIQEWADPKFAPVIAKNALLTQGIQEAIKEVFGQPGAIPIPPKTNITLRGELTPEQEQAKAQSLGMGDSIGAQGQYAVNVPPGGLQSDPSSKYPTFTDGTQGGQLPGQDMAQQATNPTMVTSQNQGPQPMSAPGAGIAGATSPDGSVAQVDQNNQAGGQ